MAVSLVVVVVVAIVVPLLYLVLLPAGKRRCAGRFPPSPPWGLPLLGHLHLLGALPHRALRSLAAAHGPVLLLRLGRVPVVFVSSAAAAEEVMRSRDLEFASRPRSAVAERLLYGHDVAFAPYGEYWRQTRRICVVHLLSARRVLSFRRVREEEAAALVGRVRAAALAPGARGAVDLIEHLIAYSNTVVSRAVFGDESARGLYGDVDRGRALRKLFDDFVQLLGQEPMGELQPWLGWVDSLRGLEGKVRRTFEALDSILEKVIDDHRRRRREVGRQMDDSGGDHRDFVDVLLDVNEMDKDAGIQLGTIEIKGIIMDMFAAGTDTTTTVMEWAMAELITHPDAMRNVQDEIKAVVGITGHVTEDHLDRLPYLKAVLKETFRLHPPLPLLVPHEPPADTKILGYNIPAHTRIVINAWTIGRDRATWGEHAEEFIPERFLESGLDYKGQDFVLVPFGAGRRGCPGVGFAVLAMEMALASLLYNFDWETRVVDRRSEFRTSSLDMSETNGLSVRLKKMDDDDGGGDHRDFVEVLLDVNETDKDAGVHLGTIEIKAIILDMFAAGTDTTKTAMEWAMAELITHQDAMRKAQDEIRAVAGVAGRVTEDQMDKLPYLKAVIKETLRLHPPNPLLVPHEPPADAEIQGYTVPAHTRVLINAWTIGRDPTTWGEHAEKFMPERFLDNSVDYKGQDFVLVPFGAGRRGCPGVEFAVPTMEMALARLLYNFNWETRPVDRRSKLGTSSLDMSERFLESGLDYKGQDFVLVPFDTGRVRYADHGDGIGEIVVQFQLGMSSLDMSEVGGRRTWSAPEEAAAVAAVGAPAARSAGHLYLLGALPHRALRSLAAAHGPVLLLRLGRVPVVVVSSAAAAKELMRARDEAFASRPRIAMAERLLYGGRDVATGRRVCVVHLLSARRVLSFRRVREEEVAALVERVRDAAAPGRPVVDLSGLLVAYSITVLTPAAFGDESTRNLYAGDRGHKMRKVFDNFARLLGTEPMGELLPWLGWVDALRGLEGKAQIDDHRRRREGGRRMDDDGYHRDFVDVLLDVIETDKDAGIQLGTIEIKGIILERCNNTMVNVQ
uniref:Cytochrome P450 n=1 Tax=Oryza punctata TaxID=4537 RepID=A0A0E0JFW2_ORYPU